MKSKVLKLQQVDSTATCRISILSSDSSGKPGCNYYDVPTLCFSFVGTPDRLQEETDSEGSSNAYSNFTYWKMKEEDMYRALPLTPDKEDKKFLDEDQMAQR